MIRRSGEIDEKGLPGSMHFRVHNRTGLQQPERRFKRRLSKREQRYYLRYRNRHIRYHDSLRRSVFNLRQRGSLYGFLGSVHERHGLQHERVGADLPKCYGNGARILFFQSWLIATLLYDFKRGPIPRYGRHSCRDRLSKRDRRHARRNFYGIRLLYRSIDRTRCDFQQWHFLASRIIGPGRAPSPRARTPTPARGKNP